jgi:hypothetical protein
MTEKSLGQEDLKQLAKDWLEAQIAAGHVDMWMSNCTRKLRDDGDHIYFPPVLDLYSAAQAAIKVLEFAMKIQNLRKELGVDVER